MNYANLDRLKILDYLERCGNEASVIDIITYSGAEKLRVYSLITKMELNGEIKVLERISFGAPIYVKIIQNK